jgi:hypothetical protein
MRQGADTRRTVEWFDANSPVERRRANIRLVTRPRSKRPCAFDTPFIDKLG